MFEAVVLLVGVLRSRLREEAGKKLLSRTEIGGEGNACVRKERKARSHR